MDAVKDDRPSTSRRANPWERLAAMEGTDRAARVALLLLAIDRMTASEPIPPRVGQWLGRGLRRWVMEGGDLARHLEIRTPQGSHLTISVLAQRVAEPAER